ncbi:MULTISPECIES: hypothetical protein [Lactiplantibacillus]|uniref:hypothetical protein n=1 Tax=Lactiplantibacillus TaxID=2767842 RepID=UPI001C1FDD6A|nr:MULTISPECIES: hypothetical protein [Lactiplantibacillus]MBU7504999.1 hypothetical protein [Lactiplantibacillus pentosus]MCT4443939.1 hypothetical protein [Lactiplantibacillus argentoratensis]
MLDDKKLLRKTWFLRHLGLLNWLAFWGIVAGVIALVVQHLASTISGDLLQPFKNWLLNSALLPVLFMTAVLLLALFALAWLVEVGRRCRELNYFARSLWLTVRFAHGAHRTTDNQGESAKKLMSYNRAVRHLAFYIDRKQLIVVVKIPVDNQAQELLKQQEPTIRDNAGARLADNYMLGPFEHRHQYIWLIGTAKK